MNLRSWLVSRRPAPPAPLVARMVDALGGDDRARSASVTEGCLDAATRLLEPLLRQERAGRESALDLLAADALVTYAFEAATESFDTIDATTGDAMLRLARLAGPEPRPAR